VIALDVTASGPLTALHRRHYPSPRHRHADQLVEAMRSVTGVVISKVSRTEPEAWIRYVVALR
jgi:hypothetical protein